MERSIYEARGGGEALLRLAEAWHERCLADPILAHATPRTLPPGVYLPMYAKAMPPSIHLSIVSRGGCGGHLEE